jgi:hypothetical protein
MGEVMDFLFRGLIRGFQLLPAALDRAHLQWAAREIDPQHPDVSYILHRLSKLEDRLG